MTTLVRRALASSILGACSLALALAGCGGGGSGPTDPTATPIGTGTGTPGPGPTATKVPGTGTSAVKAGEVVFVSSPSETGVGELYKTLGSGTGSGRAQITGLGKVINNPSVSTGGERIVFQFNDTPTDANANLELGLINTNGSGYRALTADSTTAGRPNDYSPFFSPDGNFIYWTSTRQVPDADQQPHIWRMSGQQGSTGRDQTQVTAERSAYPSVSNNGTLAYFALDKGSTPIAIARVGSDGVSTVTRYVGTSFGADETVLSVALSPNGNLVAYSVGTGRALDSRAGISIYNTTTGALERTIPTLKGDAHARAWSRDSQTLYFDSITTSGSGSRQIFSTTVPAGGGGQVTTEPNYNYSPALLPG